MGFAQLAHESATTALFVLLATAWSDTLSMLLHRVFPDGDGLVLHAAYTLGVTLVCTVVLGTQRRTHRRRRRKGFRRVESEHAISETM